MKYNSTEEDAYSSQVWPIPLEDTQIHAMPYELIIEAMLNVVSMQQLEAPSPNRNKVHINII